MLNAADVRRVPVPGTMLLAIAMLSCGPVPRRTQPAPAEPPLPIEMPLATLGQLQVFTTGQMTDGRNIKLRGLIRNPYSETVEGVRVIMRILSSPAPEARELDRVQKVLDERLATGEQTVLRLDVQTMYAGIGGGGFELMAFAIKRGDQVLPLPPDWKESSGAPMMSQPERETRNTMGRIITPIVVANALDATKEITCDVFVDTDAAGLILPSAWKARLSPLPLSRTVEMEAADQHIVSGEICGPVRIQIEGFKPISSEVTFIDMTPENGAYEPLVGYIVLEQSQAAVDMAGHRLIPVKHVDLK